MAEDRDWVIAGAGCVLGGLLIAAVVGNNTWFAFGGALGASIVGYRFMTKMETSTSAPQCMSPAGKQLFNKVREQYHLGAPEIPAVETPRANTLMGEQTVAGVADYPMMHRVPDVELHMDTMDDNIRPHFVGPLGPENDPVRYW